MRNYTRNATNQIPSLRTSVDLDLGDLDLSKLHSLDDTALGAIIQELVDAYPEYCIVVVTRVSILAIPVMLLSRHLALIPPGPGYIKRM